MGFVFGLASGILLGAEIFNTKIRRTTFFLIAKSIMWIMKTSDKILSKLDAGEKS